MNHCPVCASRSNSSGTKGPSQTGGLSACSGLITATVMPSLSHPPGPPTSPMGLTPLTTRWTTNTSPLANCTSSSHCSFDLTQPVAPMIAAMAHPHRREAAVVMVNVMFFLWTENTPLDPSSLWTGNIRTQPGLPRTPSNGGEWAWPFQRASNPSKQVLSTHSMICSVG